MKKILILSITALLFNCNSSAQKKESNSRIKYAVTKTDAEWKAELSSEQYYVLRQSGTESPFSSPLDKNFEKGTYHCAACNTPLFKSEHKFDSGTGWPSFDREIKGNVAFGVDN